MEINYILKRLNTIDEMLINRTKIVKKMIGPIETKSIEQIYSNETINNITQEKSSIIKKLGKEGLITDDEMWEYWLSEDFKFTPKISYDNVNLK
ncbi:MAG: putative transcriptional regulator [Polaribacter sp.]|jgi:predicted transcriptional regulator